MSNSATNSATDASAANTLVDFLADRLRTNASQAAIRHKVDGEWQHFTWQNVGQRAIRRCRVLKSLGLTPGDRVAQVAENSLDWLLTDLAILLGGGVHVPIHPTLSGMQVAEQIKDCGAKIAIFSGQAQLQKLDDIHSQLPTELQFVSYPEVVDAQTLPGRTVLSINSLENDCANSTPDDAGLLRQAQANASSDTLATILYTSGTTGEPKGVMLTHGNLVSNTLGSLAVLRHTPGDVRLGWLPLSHVFARTCDWYTTLGCGGVELVLAESRDTILADCAAVQPTLINGVPYFFEKVARGVQEKGAPPSVLPQVLGGRIRLCMSGGAALPEHVARFFNEGGINLSQGYGLTETSPVITINPDTARPASVGPAIPGVEMRIAPDGEIQTRGSLVMSGYWNKPQATAEAIVDGWFCTGDLGRIDEDGYLFITGRKKEILVTAAGKNVAPVFVETLLTEDPLITQAMVIGDGRKYLSALLVIDEAAMSAHLGQTHTTDHERTGAINSVLSQRICERLQTAGEHEQVQRFHIVDRPFGIESGELTPTLKLRRNVIAEHYAREIEAMYEHGVG